VSEEPTRVHRRPEARSWTGLALALACGFLLGVLVVAVLGGAKGAGTDTVTQRVTVAVAPAPGATQTATAPATTTAPPTTSTPTVITRTLVPELVGEPLDSAKDRTKRQKFQLTVDSGGGVFGVIRDENWTVVAQRPDAGTLLEQGSTVHVDIVRK
jgi:hypothetical protein